MAKTFFDNNPSDTNPYSDLPEFALVAHQAFHVNGQYSFDDMAWVYRMMCEYGTPRHNYDSYYKMKVSALYPPQGESNGKGSTDVH